MQAKRKGVDHQQAPLQKKDIPIPCDRAGQTSQLLRPEPDLNGNCLSNGRIRKDLPANLHRPRLGKMIHRPNFNRRTGP